MAGWDTWCFLPLDTLVDTYGMKVTIFPCPGVITGPMREVTLLMLEQSVLGTRRIDGDASHDRVFRVH